MGTGKMGRKGREYVGENRKRSCWVEDSWARVVSWEVIKNHAKSEDSLLSWKNHDNKEFEGNFNSCCQGKLGGAGQEVLLYARVAVRRLQEMENMAQWQKWALCWLLPDQRPRRGVTFICLFMSQVSEAQTKNTQSIILCCASPSYDHYVYSRIHGVRQRQGTVMTRVCAHTWACSDSLPHGKPSLTPEGKHFRLHIWALPEPAQCLFRVHAMEVATKSASWQWR